MFRFNSCFFPALTLSLMLTTTHAFVATPPRHTASSITALEAYKKVFVAGATRGVGRCVLDQLVAEGIEVVTLVRDPQVAEELNAIHGVTAVVGDAFHIKDVEHAMCAGTEGKDAMAGACDAAISLLGGPPTPDGKRIDYEGSNNVIESAGIYGITRVILVTSVGCGNSKEATPDSVYETLKEVLLLKQKAENVLTRYYTNMNWTIIRPGGLKSEPATGKAMLTQDHTAIGAINREDVAALIIQALHSDKTERKILTAIDPTITSQVNVDGKTFEPFSL